MKTATASLLSLVLSALSAGVAVAEVPADSEPVVRIGIAGCHRQDNPAPALWRYVAAEPDLMLWVGDNVYADTADDIGHLERQHAMLGALPAFERLREQCRTAATWDDHDFGMNNDGRNYPLKEASKQHFRRFWDLESEIPADHDGVYHARYFGQGDQRLQVLLLDCRFNRDDEGDQSDTLGENQWRWLGEELRKPAALRLIVSGYQFFLPKDSKFETWTKFPMAKARLLELIRDSEAEGVVFIAGDQHYGEVSRVPGLIGYDAIELMFCGINQEESHVPNDWRVSPVAHAKNAYALIDIQWARSELDEPHFVVRMFDADRDAAELTYRVNLRELTR